MVAALRDMLQISAISSNDLTQTKQGRLRPLLQNQRFSSVAIQSITLFEAVRRMNENKSRHGHFNAAMLTIHFYYLKSRTFRLSSLSFCVVVVTPSE